MTKTLRFVWNIPADYDGAEPQVSVLFDYTPGTPGWEHTHPNDPSGTPPCVENVRYIHDGRTVDPQPGLDEAMEQACWDELANREPQP